MCAAPPAPAGRCRRSGPAGRRGPPAGRRPWCAPRPVRSTSYTSSAYAAAVAASSAPENRATAPYQSAGSALSGAPSSFCAAASSAAPPATFAAGSVRSCSAGMPVSSRRPRQRLQTGRERRPGRHLDGGVQRGAGRCRPRASSVPLREVLRGGDRGPGVGEVHRAVAAGHTSAHRRAGPSGTGDRRRPAGRSAARGSRSPRWRTRVAAGAWGIPVAVGDGAVGDGAAPSRGSSRGRGGERDGGPPQTSVAGCGRGGRWRILAMRPPVTGGAWRGVRRRAGSVVPACRRSVNDAYTEAISHVTEGFRRVSRRRGAGLRGVTGDTSDHRSAADARIRRCAAAQGAPRSRRPRQRVPTAARTALQGHLAVVVQPTQQQPLLLTGRHRTRRSRARRRRGPGRASNAARPSRTYGSPGSAGASGSPGRRPGRPGPPTGRSG